jgi:hypothetical protein
MLRRSAGLLLLVFLFLAALAAPASAHVRDSTGYSEVTSDGDNVVYSLSLEY